MTTLESQPAAVLRRVIRVTGQVQGVGFRPFIYRLARELGLSGTVRNDPSGVTIDTWGKVEILDSFAARIRSDAPALAGVEVVKVQEETSAPADNQPFRIIASDHDPSRRGRITVDSAVCPDCLREMFDPGDRRFRHPLINCTNCGPRYTIVRDLPYDRPLTTMASFPMCASCAAEYADPADRRFHAQPTCCPECGPQLTLTDHKGNRLPGDPIQESAARIMSGKIVAIKGLGGYHLAVDACNHDAVQRLRNLKKRDSKPFAIMVRDIQAAAELVELSAEGRKLLSSPICPIVLAKRLHNRTTEKLSDAVAPGVHRLGIMIPYTPIQHLLFAEGLGPVVMTSANISDEPLVKDDAEARRRLKGIADYYVCHDRPIERAVDDSVVLDTKRGIVPIRRARGYVPAPIRIPLGVDQPGLCVGADLKNVIALVRDNEVICGHHIGDLSHAEAYRWFEKTIDDLLRLYDLQPKWIACDMHPAYLSRRFAERWANRHNIDLITVQHHHAHLASLLGEYGITKPVIGIICDGVGYGTDGTSWGGELFTGNARGWERVGRLRPMHLPGGDRAAKEITRCTLSWLHDLLGEDALNHPAAIRTVPDINKRRTIFSLLQQGLNCPVSSGTGRLFDAVAALLGICDYNHHEAMSGMMLETAAYRAQQHGVKVDGRGVMPLIDSKEGNIFEIDTRPLLSLLLEKINSDLTAEGLALLFHDVLADALARAAERTAEINIQRGGEDIRVVALSGGVFSNELLSDLVSAKLEKRGFTCLVHHVVPPGDGGIALGQAMAAAATLRT